MPAIAYLECVRCHHHVSAQTPQTLCPLCAGSLHVRYDTESLQKTAKCEDVGARAGVSGASLGMWRYASVLPGVTPVTLGEGWTPMIRSRRYAGLLVKEEGANPTESFKAREMGLAVSMAKHYGVQHLAIASAGNAAGALAAYAAAAGIAAHVFLPQDAPFANYLEAAVYGAEVTMVEGSISDCVRRMEAQKAAQDEVWFDVSGWEPFWTEGAKTLGYELVEQLGWTYPDAVFCPADAVPALGKAFEEMEALSWVTGKRPKLYAVRGSASGADEDEEEMLASMLHWAKEEGILLSPGGVAGAAMYERLLLDGELKAGDTTVLVNPEAGLRYADEIAAAMKLRRRDALPVSAKVGGIITPV